MTENLLSQGADWLQEQMEQSAGIDVRYRRARQPEFWLRMVPGRTPTEVTDQNGTILRGQIMDFTVRISTLINRLETGPKRPVRGDEIVAQLKNFTVVFTVTGEDFSTSHYEASDSYGHCWRIHTKSDRVEHAS